MLAANYSFSMGNYAAALSGTTKVLELTARYDGMVLSYYHQREVPIPEVVRDGLPASTRAMQSHFRLLTSWATPQEIELVWSTVGNTGPPTELTDRYRRYLADRKLYDKAVTTWPRCPGKTPGAIRTRNSY